MKNRKIVFFILSILLLASSLHAKERFIEITAKKFSYTPNIIRVNKGDVIRIRLISEDVTHGMFIDGYNIQTSANPGQEGSLSFVADKTGRFTFRCSVTCGEFHPYMVGILKVAPNRLFSYGIYLSLILGIGAVILTVRQKSVGPFKLFGLIRLDWKFELTKYKFVRALFKSRLFPFVPILINLAIFSALLLAMFTGGFSAGNYNAGIMIVWILWWVLLMLFMVPVVGRLWCMVCPFPMIGDWIQRGKLLVVGRQKSRGLNKRWPKKWNNLWPLVILFFVTTWFSGFFTVRPLASFILLGGIILTAILFSLFFQKRSFCLYACPVSGFQGLYANFSLCEVRVKDPEICKNHTPKTCVVGSDKGYGCPWMEMPYDMNRNTYCGLCLECFKTCPYDNMAFNVRPSGADLIADRRRSDDISNRRGTDEAFKALSMIGIFFSFFIAFQGPFAFVKDNIRATTLGGYLTYILEATTVDFILLPGTFLIFAFLSKIASGNKEVKLRHVFVNFSYCLIPVGLAIWGAFCFGIIMANGSYILHVISDPFSWGWNLFGTAHFPWTPVFTIAIPYLQIVAVFIGYLFALDYGFKFSVQTYSNLAEAKRGWIPILIYLTLMNILFIFTFTG